jgi:hypothetical protein
MDYGSVPPPLPQAHLRNELLVNQCATSPDPDPAAVTADSPTTCLSVPDPVHGSVTRSDTSAADRNNPFDTPTESIPSASEDFHVTSERGDEDEPSQFRTMDAVPRYNAEVEMTKAGKSRAARHKRRLVLVLICLKRVPSC